MHSLDLRHFIEIEGTNGRKGKVWSQLKLPIDLLLSHWAPTLYCSSILLSGPCHGRVTNRWKYYVTICHTLSGRITTRRLHSVCLLLVGGCHICGNTELTLRHKLRRSMCSKTTGKRQASRSPEREVRVAKRVTTFSSASPGAIGPALLLLFWSYTHSTRKNGISFDIFSPCILLPNLLEIMRTFFFSAVIRTAQTQRPTVSAPHVSFRDPPSRPV